MVTTELIFSRSPHLTENGSEITLLLSHGSWNGMHLMGVIADRDATCKIHVYELQTSLLLDVF